MSNSRKYLDANALARLRLIEFEARTVVQGIISGRHRSPLRGFSVEFAEHREYSAGDDLRRLDWKVLARTEKLYLKQYEQETNLSCLMLVDCSESMDFGSVPWLGEKNRLRTKFDHAAIAASVLSHMMQHDGDAVGLYTFNDKVLNRIAPSGRVSQLEAIFETLALGPTTGKTNFAPMLHEVSERMNRRGVVFVFSDFLDEMESLMEGIRHLNHLGHEVIAFHLMDPQEMDFPFQDPTLFRGLEGEPQLDADPASLRQSYLENLNAWRTDLQNELRKQDTDYVLLRTDELLGEKLSEYLRGRKSRFRKASFRKASFRKAIRGPQS